MDEIDAEVSDQMCFWPPDGAVELKYVYIFRENANIWNGKKDM